MLDGLSSWWSSNKEIVSREQTLTPNSTFKIENTHGHIDIKTWKQNKLVLEAVKKGSKEAIEGTSISTQYTDKGAVVRTVQDNSQTKCSVDYTVLIPQTATITLAHTDQGNITIKNTHKPIKAQTYKGSISFENITNSAQANTKSGNIKIHATKLEKTHKVLAISGKGNIKLELPPKTAAKLYAKTQRGKVTSDHPVTLAQRPMLISQKTMADLRKDVKGFIGSEDGATIKLHTSYGNVKLIEA
jgi:hypothetical protein